MPPRHVTDLLDEDLVQFARLDPPDDRARAEITARYQPLVVGMAGTFHRDRGTRHDDVVSAAQEGLQKAVRDFDLDRGVPFAAYAKAKVRGELLRHFRDERYEVHVPRTLHENAMAALRVAAELPRSTVDDPDVEGVAARLHRSEAEVIEALAVRSAERLRTAQLSTSPIRAVVDRPRDPDLAAAFEQLPTRQRRILYERFVGGRSQREIAERIGCSQGHVSRLQARAVETLREMLGPDHRHD